MVVSWCCGDENLVNNSLNTKQKRTNIIISFCNTKKQCTQDNIYWRVQYFIEKCKKTIFRRDLSK